MAQTLGSREVYDALEHELGVFMRRARAAAVRLSRAVHPELADRRAHLLDLTAEGTRRLDAVRSARLEHFHRQLSTWPEEDVRMLATLLARLNARNAD
jgi:hypothetical protein